MTGFNKRENAGELLRAVIPCEIHLILFSILAFYYKRLCLIFTELANQILQNGVSMMFFLAEKVERL